MDDILDELGPLVETTTLKNGQSIRHPAELKLNDQENAVLSVIRDDPTNMDEIVVGSGLPIHRVLSTISVLETRHLIHRVSGALVVRS